MIVLIWMRHRIRQLPIEEREDLLVGTLVVKQPVLSALLISMVFQTLILPDKPDLVRGVMTVFWVPALLIVVRKIIMPQLRWIVIVVTMLWLIADWELIMLSPVGPARLVNMGLSIALLVSMRGFRTNREQLQKQENQRFLFIFLQRASLPLGLICLASLVADIVGYTYLAKILTAGAIISIIAWLILASTFIILRTLIVLFLQTGFAMGFKVLEQHKSNIIKGSITCLRVGLLFIYVYIVLMLFQLWEPSNELLISIWKFGYTFGDYRLSVGNLISFFLVLIFSWVIGKGLKILLEIEILSRFSLPRGIPMAIGSLTQYTLITIGFFLALTMMGFDLDKIGLLLGALGVGIGFGLQNVVSNFISGLILIFERPITIGDIIEVEGVMGKVTNIGIRSSRIRQFNGNEEIIPNANLISGRVTNLTLSDRDRRFIQTILTEPNIDPQRVIDKLEKACADVDLVLKDPLPRVYFQGLQEQFLQFGVYYWVNENIFDAKSQVNLALWNALQEEGISTPVPKQVFLQEDPRSNTAKDAQA
jgi:small-conductance mechanosensitive channel